MLIDSRIRKGFRACSERVSTGKMILQDSYSLETEKRLKIDLRGSASETRG